MFYGARKFNADISRWDVSNVKTMEEMFYGAITFNQDLTGWPWSESGVKSMASASVHGNTGGQVNVKDLLADFKTITGMKAISYARVSERRYIVVGVTALVEYTLHSNLKHFNRNTLPIKMHKA